jgi:hypothetical protein
MFKVSQSLLSIRKRLKLICLGRKRLVRNRLRRMKKQPKSLLKLRLKSM